MEMPRDVSEIWVDAARCSRCLCLIYGPVRVRARYLCVTCRNTIAAEPRERRQAGMAALASLMYWARLSTLRGAPMAMVLCNCIAIGDMPPGLEWRR